MIDPYLAVGLQTKIKHVATRPEVEKNLTHIGNMIDMATHMCSLELPVRLIALGEGAFRGLSMKLWIWIRRSTQQRWPQKFQVGKQTFWATTQRKKIPSSSAS